MNGLIKTALTRGIVGLVTPGLTLVAQALKQAKEDGVHVLITAEFTPEGSVLMHEPQIVVPPKPEEPAPETAAEEVPATAPEQGKGAEDAPVAETAQST